LTTSKLNDYLKFARSVERLVGMINNNTRLGYENNLKTSIIDKADTKPPIRENEEMSRIYENALKGENKKHKGVEEKHVHVTPI